MITDPLERDPAALLARAVEYHRAARLSCATARIGDVAIAMSGYGAAFYARAVLARYGAPVRGRDFAEIPTALRATLGIGLTALQEKQLRTILRAAEEAACSDRNRTLPEARVLLAMLDDLARWAEAKARRT